MSRILVTGVNGQLGFELSRSLARRGEVLALGRERMDLSNPDSIRRAVREIAPDLIVNAAAYTAVDQAETDTDLALAVNGVAPGILAEEAKRLGVALIHYSTDYVFDGSKAEPYVEDDATCPINAYGRSKLAGEQAIRAVDVPHLILRTSWVYSLRGKNFLLTMLRLARERDELAVVSDQIGAPNWNCALARATNSILSKLGYGTPGFIDACAGQRGIYNLTASGHTSWHGFAAAIFERAAVERAAVERAASPEIHLLERVPRLKPISTEQYPLPARRPLYSVLSNAKLQRAFGVAMPDWEASLAECLSASN